MTKGNVNERYKWVILVLCFLMVFVCLGFCSSNKGLYLSAITEALNIKRSIFSISDSCRYIASALVNMMFGFLIKKFGVRKMTAVGFITLLSSQLVYAFAENVFVFCIGGALLGIGLSFTTNAMVSCIIRRWFSSNIGKYTGIVFAANGVGGAIAAQIISPMINMKSNPFGYRISYIVVSAIILVVGVVTVILLREAPSNEAKRSTSHESKPVFPDNSEIRPSKRRARFVFLLIAISVFFTGFMLQGISGAYAAHFTDVGLTPAFVATVAGVSSIALTFSKVLAGSLYDRFGLRCVLLVCQGATVIAFVSIALTNPSGVGMLLAIAFAVFYAVALPLETLVIPLIANDLFDGASYDKYLGVLIAINYAGYALGAPLVNVSFDVFGTYNPVFILFAALMVVIAILFQISIGISGKGKAKA